MLGKIKLENVLIFVIVIFMLHYFIGKCSYRIGYGFSVGSVDGQVDRAKVLYDFNATATNEITIARGDVVVVEDSSDSDWWVGFVEGESETKGYFPSSYVQSRIECVDICNVNVNMEPIIERGRFNI